MEFWQLALLNMNMFIVGHWVSHSRIGGTMCGVFAVVWFALMLIFSLAGE